MSNLWLLTHSRSSSFQPTSIRDNVRPIPTTNLLTSENEMSDLPNCPQCDGEYTYEDGPLLVCPTCAHEWSPAEEAAAAEDDATRDANGNVLENGDTVTVLKDLKFNGGVVKVGTKVKNIRIVDGDHDIDCKIDGIGAMSLKSQFVKKA